MLPNLERSQKVLKIIHFKLFVFLEFNIVLYIHLLHILCNNIYLWQNCDLGRTETQVSKISLKIMLVIWMGQ